MKEKAPRLLPVCHQVIHEHNAQYFTPFPQLSREQMEGKIYFHLMVSTFR